MLQQDSDDQQVTEVTWPSESNLKKISEDSSRVQTRKRMSRFIS